MRRRFLRDPKGFWLLLSADERQVLGAISEKDRRTWSDMIRIAILEAGERRGVMVVPVNQASEQQG